MDRRSFLQNSFGGLTALVVGNSLLGLKSNPAFAVEHVHSLSFSITDAVKEMATHNKINDARCYFWLFKEERFPAEVPGPIVVTAEGELINVTVTNDLDENHAFFIPGVVDSGPIAPGETKVLSFIAPKAGSYLYYDNLNAPVNRVMGLHGALIVMPAVLTRTSTPYSDPTVRVQRLFNDLGDINLFPGLAWGQGDPVTNTPAFRQYVWILHEASPKLFAEVGRFPRGQDYPADRFIRAFTQDPFASTTKTKVFNRKPHFFTINGQSGHFAHHNPWISPFRRVGEPVLVRVLNAGLYTHSMHYHANHFFVLAINRVVQNNLLFVDTFQVEPNEGFDFLYPYRRPPDIPNTGGRGQADPPLIGLNGRPVWPPVEEFKIAVAARGAPDSFKVRLSPLCYPMHDHTEPTQTAQGANYPMGMVSAAFFTGDRNTPGFMNFPDYPHQNDIAETNVTIPAAPEMPHEHDTGDNPRDEHDRTDHDEDPGHEHRSITERT